MYKLAKFRKQLKENVSEARYKRTTEAINDFKSCFYVRYFSKIYKPDAIEYISADRRMLYRSVRVRWDSYYTLKEVVGNNENSRFWQLTKEGMKHGQ